MEVIEKRIVSNNEYRESVKPWNFDFTKTELGLNEYAMSFMYDQVYGGTHSSALRELCYKRISKNPSLIIDAGSGPMIGLKAYVNLHIQGPKEYLAIDRSHYFLDYGLKRYSQY